MQHMMIKAVTTEIGLAKLEFPNFLCRVYILNESRNQHERWDVDIQGVSQKSKPNLMSFYNQLTVGSVQCFWAQFKDNLMKRHGNFS